MKKYYINYFKTIKLLILSFLLIGCVLDNSDKNYDTVNIEKIDVYKRFDPVTQRILPVYVATVHIDGKKQKIRVKSNKIGVIKVYKKLPSQTP